MDKKLLKLLIIFIGFQSMKGQNGTRPDSDKVIVGSQVVRTIAVLANDNAVAGKNYQLTSVFHSVTSPSTNIDIAVSGNNVTYKDKQNSANTDTFFYVAKDLISGISDTNYVVITKDNLNYDLYPGDANKDNICNNIDVLNIGIAYGKAQIVREGIFLTNDWLPVKAYDWTLSNNKSNYRYSDANGDGTVDSLGDVGTIYKNYNRTISTTNITYSPTGGQSFQIIVSDTFKVASPSSSFQIKINLGSTSTKILNAYGISFTVKYDTSILKANKINFSASKWFSDQSTTLNFSKINELKGEIDLTIVRKSGNNDAGFGELGVIDVVIDDILGGLAGGLNTNFEVTKAVLIDSTYNLLPVTLPSPKSVYVKKSSSGISNSQTIKSLNYYFNSEDGLVLENKKSSTLEIAIYNILGKKITSKFLSPYQSSDVDVSSWSQGIYFIKTNSEVYKFMKR